MQSEVEITKQLLKEAKEALETEKSRRDNVQKKFAETKEEVVKLMQQEKFDEAQAQLLEAKVLSVKLTETKADFQNAERRVQQLEESLTREEQRQADAGKPAAPASPAPEKKEG